MQNGRYMFYLCSASPKFLLKNSLISAFDHVFSSCAALAELPAIANVLRNKTLGV